MARANKYFFFNKETDFLEGYSENLRYARQGVLIDNTERSTRGYYLSPVLDSREKEMHWHRAVVRARTLGDASIRFVLYVSESRHIPVDSMTMDVGVFLAESGRTLEDKQRILAPYRVEAASNATDFLLHGAVGRYLWFSMELFGYGEDSPVVESIRIFLPKQTWLGYLPEVYQSDPVSSSFVERFLGVFQSLYDDMDEDIREASRHFDVDVAQGEFLQWLAEWIDIDNSYLWSDEQLRYLLQHGVELYRSRGTRRSLADLVALYTGSEPYIVERCMLDRYAGDARTASLITSLYGDHSYMVTVVVYERDVPSTERYKTLLKIIENVKPAHVDVNLVALKPYIFLGQYSYLGMNSVLGQYRSTSLNGFSAVSFTNISGGPADLDNSADRKDEAL